MTKKHKPERKQALDLIIVLDKKSANSQEALF